MEAKTGGEYTAGEFKKGCQAINVDTELKWQQIVPKLQQDLKKNAELFDKIYEFAFEYYWVSGYKNIEKEYAIALWPLLLGDKCKFL